MIIQRLHELQHEHGYLPDEDLKRLALEIPVPLYRIQELVSFYPHFRPQWMKPPYLEVMICRDMSCHLNGSSKWIAGNLGLKLDSMQKFDYKLKHSDGRIQVGCEILKPGEDAERFAVKKHGRSVELELVREIKTLNGREIEIKSVSCLGRCDRAVACVVNRHEASEFPEKGGHHGAEAEAKKVPISFVDRLYAGLTEEEMRGVVEFLTREGSPESAVPPPPALLGGTPDRTYNPPHADPNSWMIDIYRQYNIQPSETEAKQRPKVVGQPPFDHYRVVRKYLEEHEKPIRYDEKAVADRFAKLDEIHPYLNQLRLANLQGMGGAGKPAFTKWLDVWKEDRPVKYVVGNGDESEPGTFKDRELLLKKSHLVVEGLLMGVLMTGATEGHIFIRHEYTEQIEAMKREMVFAKTWLAGAFKAADRAWPKIEVFTSPGNYICGEQSALIEAMEDHRAQPRNRPPELGTNGLWDCPTVVNNVETLAWVPAILMRKSPWYTGEAQDERRRDEYTGAPIRVSRRRLLSISGDVRKPGAFEVPKHTTIGELIEMAGGLRPGKKLRAVATSGPSGGFLPAEFQVADDLGRKKLSDCLRGFRENYQQLDFRAFWDRHVRRYAGFEAALAKVGLPDELQGLITPRILAESLDMLQARFEADDLKGKADLLKGDLAASLRTIEFPPEWGVGEPELRRFAQKVQAYYAETGRDGNPLRKPEALWKKFANSPEDFAAGLLSEKLIPPSLLARFERKVLTEQLKALAGRLRDEYRLRNGARIGGLDFATVLKRESVPAEFPQLKSFVGYVCKPDPEHKGDPADRHDLEGVIAKLRGANPNLEFARLWNDLISLPDEFAETIRLVDLPLDKNFFDVLPRLLHDVPSAILLGAGIVVYDDGRDMLVEARNCTQFFRNETCGKCVPCRIGTQKLVELGTSLLLQSKKALPDDGDIREAPDTFLAGGTFGSKGAFRKNFDDLHEVMKSMSICSLGQSAPSPLRTALRWF